MDAVQQPVGCKFDCLFFWDCNDLSFDIDVIQRHGASVVAWDPTINREQFERALLMTNPSASDRRRITFHPFGIAAGDDVLPFYRSLDPRSKSLSSTPNLRGYSTRAYLRAPVMRVETLQAIASAPHVDVLKLDVEGAEFPSLAAEAAKAFAHGSPGRHPRRLRLSSTIECGSRDLKPALDTRRVRASFGYLGNAATACARERQPRGALRTRCTIMLWPPAAARLTTTFRRVPSRREA